MAPNRNSASNQINRKSLITIQMCLIYQETEARLSVRIAAIFFCPDLNFVFLSLLQYPTKTFQIGFWAVV